MFLDRERYRPRYMSRLQLRKMRDTLQQLNGLVEKIDQDKANFSAKILHLDQNIQQIFNNKFGLPSEASTGKKVSKLNKQQTDQILGQVRVQIDALLTELQAKLTEQERLQRLAKALEEERKQREEVERRQREAEEMRKRKAELEERKRQEMLQQQQYQSQREAETTAHIFTTKSSKLSTASTQTDNNQQLDSFTIQFNEEERRRQAEYLKRLEQERRDYELAVRLSQQDGGGNADLQPESSPPTVIKSSLPSTNPFHGNENISSNNASTTKRNNSKLYNLESWNYAQLRDTINTSSDIELLEACREEFHRRLKVYHQWKFRMNHNKQNRQQSSSTMTTGNQQQQQRSYNPFLSSSSEDKHQSSAVRAPDIVMDTYYNVDSMSMVPGGGGAVLMQMMNNGNPELLGNNGGSDKCGVKHEQRFFRLPFVRQTGEEKGLWYAHFDGRWIARQMEIHPTREPILLLSGKLISMIY